MNAVPWIYVSCVDQLLEFVREDDTSSVVWQSSIVLFTRIFCDSRLMCFTHRCVTEKMGNFDERLCLQWNHFRKNISSTFGDLREDKEFTDVTMACEDGQQVKAHKVVLIASSPFFLNILRFIITFIITFMRLPSSRRELLSELTKTEKSHKQERMN